MATTLAETVTERPKPLPPRAGGRPSKARLEQERLYKEQLSAFLKANPEEATDEDLDDVELGLSDDDLPETPAAISALPQGTAEGAAAGDEWNWISSFTPAEWENTILYLYRVEPRINRRSGGRPSNIGKYSEAIDPDAVKREHGSGVYQLSVNRKRTMGGTYDRLAVFNFEVLDMNYPPRVPPGQWLDDPINRDWEWAKPALERTAANPAAPGGADTNVLLNTVIAALERNSPKQGSESGLAQIMVAMINANAAQNSPDKLLAMVTAMTPKDTPAIVQLLMQQNNNMQAELGELRRALMNKPEPKGLVESITELLPAIQAIKGLARGGGAAATESPWVAIVEKIVEAAGQVTPAIAQAIASRPIVQAPPPAAPATPPPAPAAAAAPPPAAPPPAAPPVNGHAANPTAAPPQPTGGTPAVNMRLISIVGKWRPTLEQCTEMMEGLFRTKTGYDFRDWFVEKFGKPTWEDFKKDTGPEMILELVGMAPDLSVKFAPLKATPDNYSFEKFCSEFFTEPGHEPETDIDDDSLEEIAPPAARAPEVIQ